MSVLGRPHVYRPGSGHPPLLLLHGTGGDEHDLLGLAESLAPHAPLLAPRGTVNENGAVRFFRRRTNGSFDEPDLQARADDLADFVTAAGDEYGVTSGSWFAVGFSNGANIASALLLTYPELLAGALLMAAMVPFTAWPDTDLSGKWVAVANGRGDPLADPSTTARLVRGLRERGAQVVELHHRGGHAVDGRIVEQAAALLAARPGHRIVP